MAEQRAAHDPCLAPYKKAIEHRIRHAQQTELRLTGGKITLEDFASGHEFFGMHKTAEGWVFREWAPNATGIHLIGDFSGWEQKDEFALTRSENGVWEIRLPREALSHLDLFRLKMHWGEGSGDRIPAYARRVVQDPDTKIFNAQVWAPPEPYAWKHAFTRPDRPLLVYEAHAGMAQEEPKVGSWREFAQNVLPRIHRLGYNAIQLMAVQEHPYYGSFGYQVSNFFAASSRFGTPKGLKELIDTAHGMGIAVIMDLVHSHAVANEVEGLARFDGTPYQYFHEGGRGRHPLWDSMLFDYSKPQVLHFLLSNCRFWLDEYRVDGFRFDGVTSMLYLHHGMGKAFTSYDDYFDGSVDEDALAYLRLANKLIHAIRPDAVTVAEDVSGMPGLACPLEQGGTGFDYRYAMGVPDYWIKLLKEMRDEDWPMGHLWFELTNRRTDEKTISYAESHDQALVGDKTIMMWLAGKNIYDHMNADDPDMVAQRAVALHKAIRLVTLSTAQSGYLNFMGNEFGHPEWIDFPRPGNNWSCWYARRQWSLADNPKLKYHYLEKFDQAMVRACRDRGWLAQPGPYLLHLNEGDMVLAFVRGFDVFVFNFHPTRSFTDYRILAPAGVYQYLLDSDDPEFLGHGRLDHSVEHHSSPDDQGRVGMYLYIPNRTGFVLKRKE
ncbi:MAG: alpha amylase C-terminal domain-containing protein [Deltaproteobacteria bacterium]|nr:alpha amylase C-terminal domain-containing protein [Deltaproteobacteria bacterium]